MIPIFVVIFADEKSADKLFINREILLLLQERHHFIVNKPLYSIHPFYYLISYRILFFSLMDLFSEIGHKSIFYKNLVQFFCLYVFMFLSVKFQMKFSCGAVL